MHSLNHFTKIILMLLFSISANHTQAQVAIEWQKCFGGTGLEYAISAHNTFDGGYILAGTSSSNDGDVTGNHGNEDYWVIKLDMEGNLQWQKSYGGSNIDRATDVLQTFDGGYILSGYTWSDDGDVTGYHGSADFWIVKIDGVGNIIWQQCFGGSHNDIARSVQQTSDGGFIVAGQSSSTDGNLTNNHGGMDVWIVKLDNNGSLQWQSCYGGSINEDALSVQLTIDGGYVFAGYSNSNDYDVMGNHGSYDYWIVKLDNIGNIQWQKCLGGTDMEYAHTVNQTTDEGYVISGRTNSTNGDVSGNHGNHDYWVIKLDSFGNIQWHKCLGGTNDDFGYAVQQTAEGGYVVVGRASSGNGDITGNYGSYDFWAAKLDGNGSLQWQKNLGGTNWDEAFSVIQSFDGGIVMAGFTASNDGDVTGNHGNDDFWVVKLTEHYNNITGKLYADLNSNNVQDTGELVLVNRKVTVQSTGRFGFSNSNGEYHVLVLDSGNYSVAANAVNHFSATPANHTAYFSAIQQSDSLNDFAFQPNSLFNDLCITITPATPFRQGMNATYVIHYENVGTTTISNCSVIFFPHNLVSFAGANVTPFAITPDSVTWNIGTLTPFQSGSIVVTVNVQLGTPIGSIINSGARIEPVAGDANPNCNTNYWEVVTTGAVDPNDILVNRTTVFTTEFPNPPFLDYIIRFQNVGNDTAFTVRVYNPIDTTKLEISSLEFVASSHPVDMMYVFHERHMKFTFNNIFLVDSTTNEPMSHGFVRYKIKPKSNLVVNDSIRNSATIHFDFEAPVLTNTALTTVEQPTGLPPGNNGNEHDALWIWPNPVKENVSVGIRLKTATEVNLEVINLYGQTVLTKKLTGKTGDNQFEISLENLPNGVYFIKADVAGKLSQMMVVKL